MFFVVIEHLASEMNAHKKKSVNSDLYLKFSGDAHINRYKQHLIS